MEGLLVLLALFFMASPVIAIVALIKASNLRRDLEQLQSEIRQSQSCPAPYEDTAAPVSQPTNKAETARAALKQAPAKTVKSRPVPAAPSAAVTSKPVAAKPTSKITTNPQRHKVTPKKPKASLEEMIGSQWSVWVGGLALAIGAIFLLRFSIESGVFTPSMRLILASILGLLALGSGEWLRRRDDAQAQNASGEKAAMFQQAYIPGILTAVGIFTGLGVIYAAHAIYAFIGPAPAFALLGLTSLIGLVLGLLHGPKMAAFGLIAGLITPLLINTDLPNYAALYGYLLLVGGAALVLAQKRNWSGISVLALFGLLGWVFLSQSALQVQSTAILWTGFSAAAYAASLWAAHRQEAHDAADKDAPKRPAFDIMKFDARTSVLWTAGLALITLLIYDLSGRPSMTVWASLTLAALFIAAGAWQRRFNLHILIGGALGSLLALWGALDLNQNVILVAALSLILWALCFRESRLPKMAMSFGPPPLIWAGLSAAVPIGLWGALSLEKGGAAIAKTSWLHISGLGPFEGLAYVACAVVLGGTAEYLWRHGDKTNPKAAAVNIYAIGAGAAILLGLLFCLNIDVKFYAALIGGVMGLALYHLRPIWSLRMMIAGALLLGTLFAVLHHIQGGDVGPRYIVNALWIFLALPAVISFVAAKRLSRLEEDLWSEGLKALALSLAALFAVMQIHHLMNGGQVLATSFSLEEAALFVLTGICFTFGSAWMERNVTTPIKSRPIHKQLLPFLSIGLSVITLGVFVLAVCLDMNPLLNNEIAVKGVWMLNTLLLAYLLPALFMGAIAVWSRKSRPQNYVRAMAVFSLISFMIYITASVRHIFSRESLSLISDPPGGLELYAISAAWLVVGIALLVVGLKTRRQDIRIVSGLIIILTILKAFLIDMASLEGVLRAMSFVILGLVLIVIGRVYQKLIFKGGMQADAEIKTAPETD